MMNLQPWQSNTLQCLRELSSLDQQRHSWIDGDASQAPDPDELICQLFDDTGLDAMLKAGSVFSEMTDDLLRTMSKLVGTIDTSVPPEQLLKDDRWRALSKQAARAHELVLADLSK